MIQFLLDTNVLLWYFWGSSRVEPVEALICAEDVDVFFSSVSLWEITTKARIGKLVVDVDELYTFAKEHAFFELPVTGRSMKAYRELPDLHRDPFDHMLLAQALTCPMRFITGDSQLADYSSLVMVI